MLFFYQSPNSHSTAMLTKYNNIITDTYIVFAILYHLKMPNSSSGIPVLYAFTAIPDCIPRKMNAPTENTTGSSLAPMIIITRRRPESQKRTMSNTAMLLAALRISHPQIHVFGIFILCSIFRLNV